MARVVKKFKSNLAWKCPAGVNNITIVGKRQTRAVPTINSGIGYDSGVSDPAGPHFIDNFGTLWGWGAGVQGITGQGTATPFSSPVAVAGGRTWEYVNSMWNSSIRQVLAMTRERDLYVWGTRGAAFPLGAGETANASSPLLVLGSIKWKKAWNNAGAFFGTDMMDRPYAWGLQATNAALLGLNTTTATSSPVLMVGNLRASRIVASPVVSMILTPAGDAYACGAGAFGSLGQVGSMINRSSPVLVSGGFKWADLNVNFGSCFGVTTDGDLYAWGDNSFGMVADVSIMNLSTPTLFSGGKRWARVKNAGTIMMAQEKSGTWYTWGPGPSYGYSYPPVEIDKMVGPGISTPTIVVGQKTRAWKNIFFTTANTFFFQDQEGFIYGYGSNGEGQLGIGTSDFPDSPTILVGSPKFLKVWGYTPNLEFASTSYGLDAQGKLWSWGMGGQFAAGGGQLGDGTIVSKSSPVLVLGERIGRTYDICFNQTVDVNPGTTYNVNIGSYFAAFGNIGVGEDIEEIEISYDL